jgi:hypothetical protein
MGGVSFCDHMVRHKFAPSVTPSVRLVSGLLVLFGLCVYVLVRARARILTRVGGRLTGGRGGEQVGLWHQAPRL